MDYVMGVLVFLAVSLVGVILVDRLWLALKPFKEISRKTTEHEAIVVGKRFLDASISSFYRRSYHCDDSAMNPIMYQEFNYHAPLYEVEVILDIEARKVFNDRYLYDTCKQGESYKMMIEEVKYQKKSLLMKEECRSYNLVNFEKIW